MFCLLTICGAATAVDLTGLSPIGPVTSFTRTDTAVMLACADQSEVQISLLAPDLVRVRASFRKKLPAADHSWAIAKTSWDAPQWNLREEPGILRISTGELEVVVSRDPLLISFRDAQSRQTINADQQPMQFDPQKGTVAAVKQLRLEEHFYGLGEKAARLDKRRGEFTMWNSDTPGYAEGRDPIYQSIPFYIGWEAGRAYGIFFDNSYRTHFDFGRTSQEHVAFTAEGGEMNYYFFRGPSITKILGRYADLTGHMPMLPKWSLGNQQSRYSYYPDSLAEAIVDKYRAEDLPLDVLYLDIHYMNGYRDFTFDPQRFPDPKAFTDKLKSQGVKVVTIVDPGIKYQPPASGAKDSASHPELAPQDQSYYVFNQGLAQDFFLRRKDGRLYLGRVWPGDSVFVDYTIDAAARWWGGLHRAYTDQGIAGIWNDMNEPADFVDQSGQAQADVVTYDGGAHTSYAQNRNVFALNMARATYEGLQRLLPDRRPYVITRAAYAGIQRYSTMWTGDNNATWGSLSLSLPMFMTLGLSGEPFVGADVGGFMGNTNPELLVRWYEVGCLTPFLRNHGDIGSYDHEPWRFGTYYEDIIRKYLKLRYRLLPFLYTAMEEAHRTGVPMFRPLLLNYQDDANTVNIDDEFTIGRDLLAAPVVGPGAGWRLVYLPAGTWFDYWTGERLSGGRMIRVEAPLDILPLFIRGGAIIPSGPEMHYVDEKPADPIRFEIWADAQGLASTTLYEDDGLTPDYLRGVFRRTGIACVQSQDGVEINLSAPEGTYRPAPHDLVFAVHAPPATREVLLDGNPLPLLAGGRPGRGWSHSAGLLAIQIADDGRIHQIRSR